MLNLDTHILIFALSGELTQREARLLGNDEWGISAIVLWELSKLVQLKRVSIDLDSADFTRILGRVHVWPLDLAVCKKIQELDFRSDPADEIIAATSIVYKAKLVTRDRRLLESKLVPLAR